MPLARPGGSRPERGLDSSARGPPAAARSFAFEAAAARYSDRSLRGHLQVSTAGELAQFTGSFGVDRLHIHGVVPFQEDCLASVVHRSPPLVLEFAGRLGSPLTII